MIWILLTFLIGTAGGLLFLKLKFPAGAMVGAMAAAAVFSIVTGRAELPVNLRLITQMIAGAYIGSSIQYKDVLALRRIILPAFLMIFSMITLDLIMGFFLYRATSLDLPTALMASAPGGLMDISLMSADVGADASQVALLQLLRLMTVMSFFPLMLKKISGSGSGDRTARDEDSDDPLELSDQERTTIRNHWYLSRRKRENLTLTLVIALMMGYLGYRLGIPAGALTFSMIFAALFNILTGRGYLPASMRLVTQMLAGTLIGVRMRWEDINALRTVFVPALLLMIGIILINLTVGYLLDRLTGIGRITALIASVPGGMSDMALIAGDLGGDQSKVAVLQLFRYVFVVAVYPVIIAQLIRFIA